MKIKLRSRLWIYFVTAIFFIMLATSMIVAVFAFLLLYFGRLGRMGGSPMSPILLLLFISVILGTFISLFVAKRMLEPVAKFSMAAREVAKGNFDIRLDESERVAEFRELTRNFNMMVHELSCNEMLRKDFIDNVSHEFKTPISAIEGYAALLQEKNLSEDERDEYVRLIIDSSRQLSYLSENILKLSKLENQELVLDKRDFRLDEQIRRAVLLLENRWSEKNIELEIDLDRIVYHWNEDLLDIVWLNLLDNAVKFTPDGGRIAVRLSESPGKIHAEITDSGVGIDHMEIQRIFDKFYQGDSARKRVGNGLGLALVSRIVALNRGKIEVQSILGEGTSFTVTLPAEEEI